ncbi:MAG: PAS domain S-box protein [Eubacteriales bacterium]
MTENSYKVLIADSDSAARLALRRCLESDGYTVIEAENGEHAFSIYKEQKPDIVLIDVIMPVMDGLTACALFQELSEGGRKPLIMLTGLDDNSTMELALKVGAADFITKPINWAVLRERMRRLLHARLTEELLDKSRANAQTIISISIDGIIITDANNRIRSFNPAAERIFSYISYEVIGQNVEKLMPGAIRKKSSRTAKDRLTDQEKMAFKATREITGKKKDGSTFPAELTISGYPDGEQVLTVRDITERKQTENELRTAAKVFESTSEGIMVTDTKENIRMVNSAFSVITGYSDKEAVGKKHNLLDSGMQDAVFLQGIHASLRKLGKWRGETWFRRKSGVVFPARLSISAIKDLSGQAEQYVFVFSDITEEVQLREERQRLQEQTARAHKLASLGTISAGIAHEINQPLNSIKVIAEGMLYWHKRGHILEMEKVIKNLQKISAQSSRIDEIIKHMRSFVRVGDVSDLVPCNVNDAFKGALDLLGSQLSSHGIEVKQSLAKDLLRVLGNSRRLEEVLVNLLVNAMQALDKVGSADKEIFCRTLYEGKKIIFEISDNATGVSQEVCDKIFDPFFTTKAPGEGMGLGLSIAQSIVTSYGGEIKVLNNEKGGATFRVELPPITDKKPDRGWPGEYSAG